MSIEALNWAIDSEGENASAKLVLLILANYADDHAECWPPRERLEHVTGLSRSTVKRVLSSLETAGLIARVLRHDERGLARSSVYRLQLRSQGGHGDPPGGQTELSQG